MKYYIVFSTIFQLVLVQSKPTPKPKSYRNGYWGPGSFGGALDTLYPYGYWTGMQHPIDRSISVLPSGLPVYRRSNSDSSSNPITKTINYLTSFLPSFNKPVSETKSEDTPEIQDDDFGYFNYYYWDDDTSDGKTSKTENDETLLSSDDEDESLAPLVKTSKEFKNLNKPKSKGKKSSCKKEETPVKEVLLYRLREYQKRQAIWRNLERKNIWKDSSLSEPSI